MEIVRDILLDAGQPTVRRYRPGEIRLRGVTYAASIIVTPNDVIDDWPPQNFDSLAARHLEVLVGLEPRPDMILLGTGEHQHFPGRDVLEPLLRSGLGVEIMDTAAACRTWNILLSENRHAVAALIIR